MDKVDSATRSEIMGKVRSKETKLEKTFRKLLWKQGFRYTKNNKKYYGKPDLVFKSKKIVIFIDSCYWHGCKDHLRMPSSNIGYWKNKIQRNIARDEQVNIHYVNEGWSIIRIWEHEIKTEELTQKWLTEISNILTMVGK